MSDTITHIAGVRLNVCGRIVQRCSLCGAKLCDSQGVSMPVPPEYEGFSNDEKLEWFDKNFSSWEVGRLVQVDAGNPTRSSLLPDTDRLPDWIWREQDERDRRREAEIARLAAQDGRAVRRLCLTCFGMVSLAWLAIVGLVLLFVAVAPR